MRPGEVMSLDCCFALQSAVLFRNNAAYNKHLAATAVR